MRELRSDEIALWRRRAGDGSRGVIVAGTLLALWQVVSLWSELPAFMLPAPSQVLSALAEEWRMLLPHAATTALETALGLAAGVTAGVATALAMAAALPLRRILLPVLVVTQALPVFAIAPLLVLWFGFGLASKIVMAGLIIYFPVASTFYDALLRTEPGLLDLARLARARRWQTLFLIRVPAALPALGSGLRISATLAPIGAVVGEWVGAAAGLGFVMIQAQARVQTDIVFAALALLVALALLLRAAADQLARRIAPWEPDNTQPLGDMA